MRMLRASSTDCPVLCLAEDAGLINMDLEKVCSTSTVCWEPSPPTGQRSITKQLLDKKTFTYFEKFLAIQCTMPNNCRCHKTRCGGQHSYSCTMQ